jgi:choline transport protein
MGNEHEMKSAGATETAMDKDYSTGEMDLEPQAHDKDMIELARQGKKQVLKRNFGFVSMSGFCCTVISTWATVLVTLFVGFQNGGPAGLVYGYIFIFIGTLASMTVLSELASMAPTAGGQYHWVSMLAPRSTRKYTSYIIGWLTATGWIANFAAGCFLTGTLIQGLVILNYPDYVPQPFHSTMFMWFMIVVVVLVNTVMSALLPFLETMMLLIFVLSFFGILIPLVYFAPHGMYKIFQITFRITIREVAHGKEVS